MITLPTVINLLAIEQWMWFLLEK